MLEFFSSISSAITSFVNYFVNGITNTVSVLLLLPQAVSFLYESIAFLPPAIVIFATLGIVITIVFLIIGR